MKLICFNKQADPEFVNITSIIQELVSKDHASRIRPRIDLVSIS
jgi:hypothetical protein